MKHLLLAVVLALLATPAAAQPYGMARDGDTVRLTTPGRRPRSG